LAYGAQVAIPILFLLCSPFALIISQCRDPTPATAAARPENRTPTRFNLPEREADGDWLDAREELDGEAPPLRTTVTVEKPKTIITRNASPDLGFDRSINPSGLRTWLHYCFARPTTHSRFSPGLDFERACSPSPTRRNFSAPSLPGPLRGPADRDGHQHRSLPSRSKGTWRITRSILEILAETGHPVTITPSRIGCFGTSTS